MIEWSSGLAVRELVRTSPVYVLASGLQLLGGLLVLPILTRTISAHDYGVVAVALIIYNLALAVASAGLPKAVSSLFYSPEVGADGARALTVLSFGIGLTIVLVGLALGPALGVLPGLGSSAAVAWALVAVAAAAPVATSQGMLRSQNRAFAFAVLALLLTVGSQGLGLLGASFAGSTGYLAGFAVGNVVALCLAAVLIRGPVHFPPLESSRGAHLVSGCP